MELIYIIIMISCIGLSYKYLESQAYDVVYVKGEVTGQSYLVRNLPDKQNAANILDQMNYNFQQLIEYLKNTKIFILFKKYVIKKPNLQSIEELTEQEIKQLDTFNTDIKRLIKNYNPNALSENIPSSMYTSYSENKGQRIVFCMRNKKTDELVDLNTMMFVGLHELSHLMTKTIGHKPEFWYNFRILLRISITIEIYDCINYNIESKNYCGTKITDSPLKCSDV